MWKSHWNFFLIAAAQPQRYASFHFIVLFYDLDLKLDDLFAEFCLWRDVYDKCNRVYRMDRTWMLEFGDAIQ